MNQPETYWGHVIKGLSGCLNMLEANVQESIPISPHWYEELVKCQARLTETISKVTPTDR